MTRHRGTRNGGWLALALLAAACSGGGEKEGSSTAESGEGATSYRTVAPGVSKGTVASRELAPEVDAATLARLVSGNTEFALTFLELVSEAAPSENVAFGAYSVSQVMAMVYGGARGETREQMKAALHYELDGADLHAAFNLLDSSLASRNGDVLLRNVNQVWMDPRFEAHADYLEMLARDYGAPLAQLDFARDPEAGRAQINRWVKESTEQRIAELLPPGSIDARTAMVLSNAMYLDAPWHFAFPADATTDTTFTLADGTRVQAPTLHQSAQLRAAEGDGWRAVALPYRGQQLAMLVVVPDQLATFEASLTAESLATLRGQLAEQSVQLALPRFELGSHVSLVQSLRALGLGSLFESPDLSGMTDQPVWIGAVEHEAIVEVSEDGTRAAAATAATVQTRSAPRAFAADRPFLFFVIDEPTGSVLFLGKVLDPR